MNEIIGYIGLVFTISYGYLCLRNIEIIERIIDKVLNFGRQRFRNKIPTYWINHLDIVNIEVIHD